MLVWNDPSSSLEAVSAERSWPYSTVHYNHANFCSFSKPQSLSLALSYKNIAWLSKKDVARFGEMRAIFSKLISWHIGNVIWPIK